MAELTEHATWWCQSNVKWVQRFESNSTRGQWYLLTWGRLPPGAATEYGYTCDCWPFKRTGKCNHIKWADHCRWNWEMEVGAEANTVPCGECGHPKTVCPECGGPAEAIRVAV